MATEPLADIRLRFECIAWGDYLELIIFDFNRTLYNPDEEKLFDGVIPLLEKLCKKSTLAIIGKGDDKRKNLISDLNIRRFFSEIVIKPDKTPEDYTNIMKKFNATPDGTLVVGDRVKEEIKCAKAAGAKTAWFRNGKFASEIPADKSEEPDYIINDLRVILDIK